MVFEELIVLILQLIFEVLLDALLWFPWGDLGCALALLVRVRFFGLAHARALHVRTPLSTLFRPTTRAIPAERQTNRVLRHDWC